MDTVTKKDTRGYAVEVPANKRTVMQEKGAEVTEEFLSTAGDGGKRYQMHNLDGAKDGKGRPTGASLGQSIHPRHYNSEAIELARSRGEHVGVVDMQTGRVLVEAMPGDGVREVFYRKFYHQEGAGYDDKAGDREGILEQGTLNADNQPRDTQYWNPQGQETGQSGERDGKRSQKGGQKRAAAGREHAAEGDSAVREV